VPKEYSQSSQLIVAIIMLYFVCVCVYHYYNSKDGARVTTRIKKVTGDNDAFLSELRARLELPKMKNERDETIRIRTGGTVEIKGNRVLEVKHWLAGLGF
jgi:hypothetical protein